MTRSHRTALVAVLALVALLAPIGPAAAQSAPPTTEGDGGEIIGGTRADPGEYPFQVALLQRGVADRWSAQFCGGSLISPDTVLTAGHCVVGATAADIDVLAGTHTLRVGGGGRRVPVRSIRLHPGYDDAVLANDIAILQLGTRLPYPTVRPASAGDTGLYPPATTSTVIGWGDDDITPATHYPRDLREVEVPIVDDAACNAAYDDTLFEDQVVCAGDTVDGGEDSCQGDSGGPLLVPDGPDWVQIGVVSTGNGCARQRFPGIYTEVAHYPFVQRYLDPDSVPDPVRTPRVRHTADGPLVVWRAPVFDGGTALTGFRVELPALGRARLVRAPWATLGNLPPGRHRVEVSAVNPVGRSVTRAVVVNA